MRVKILVLGSVAVIVLGLLTLAAPGNGNGNGSGIIDFEGIAAGTIVTVLSEGSGVSGNLSGVIKVDGSNGASPNNAAMIFDTSCPPGYVPSDCSGSDDDLGTPNEAFNFKPAPGPAISGPGHGAGGFPSNKFAEGNILILTEDFDASDPDDADNRDMYVDFDFSMASGGTEDTVTINSVAILDVETEEGEDGAFIDFWTDGNSPPSPPTDMIAIPPNGDNGRTDINNIKLKDVNWMRVNLNGSGAILSTVFGAREEGTCWSTSGGFQNAGFQAGAKDFTFGGNVGPPPSGVWEVVEHISGNNFHSNDVSVVDCIVNENLTGPEQPGGKKGFKDNVLLFSGTGRLRDADDNTIAEGLAFRGCVIDAGEPQGMQGLDNDYFEIVVCKSGIADCTYETGLCSDTSVPADFIPTASQDTCDSFGADVVFAACASLDGGNFQLHPPTGKSN